MNNIIQEINKEFYGDCDFVQTSPCGRGQRHPHGMTGFLFRIKNPNSVRVGDCFMNGRLKANDLWLCTEHSGDCFQDYIYIKEYSNILEPHPELNFGSYGIGNSEKIEISEIQFSSLKSGTNIPNRL